MRWFRDRKIGYGWILDRILKVQNTINHANTVVMGAGGERKDVEPSEAVAIEYLTSSDCEGGPIDIGESEQGFSDRSDTIGRGD